MERTFHFTEFVKQIPKMLGNCKAISVATMERFAFHTFLGKGKAFSVGSTRKFIS